MAVSDKETNLIYQAKLSELAERYDDMVQTMKEIVGLKKESASDLTVEERNLLSVAYKNVIGARRASWRVIFNLENHSANEDNRLMKDYRQEIEKELNDTCSEVLDVLENLIPNAGDTDSKVFYLKMSADYYRYSAEYLSGAKRSAAAESSKKEYEKASEEAKNLATTHPIRLGLALNYSVFHYEIMDNSKDACEIAQKAFDDAMSDLDQLQEDKYKDSTLIMQLLRDNLTLWTSEMEEGSTNKDKEDSKQ